MSGLTGLKYIPSNRQLIEREGASRRVVDHDVVERILILIISDNKVRTEGIPYSEGSHIVLLDDEYMAEVKEVQFVIERIRIGIHSSVPDGAFSVWTVVVLALICVLCVLVQIEIVIEEITIHEDRGDYRGAIIAQ